MHLVVSAPKRIGSECNGGSTAGVFQFIWSNDGAPKPPIKETALTIVFDAALDGGKALLPAFDPQHLARLNPKKMRWTPSSSLDPHEHCRPMNCPGFSGEQSAKQTSRKLSGNKPNSEHAEFGCSRKIVPVIPATAHPTLDRGKLGCSRFTLRQWCIQMERENKELRTANEILKKASAYFAQAEIDRPFRR